MHVSDTSMIEIKATMAIIVPATMSVVRGRCTVSAARVVGAGRRVALGAAPLRRQRPRSLPHPPPLHPLQVDPEELQLRKQALLAAMHKHRMVLKLPSRSPGPPSTRLPPSPSASAPLTASLTALLRWSSWPSATTRWRACKTRPTTPTRSPWCSSATFAARATSSRRRTLPTRTGETASRSPAYARRQPRTSDDLART